MRSARKIASSMSWVTSSTVAFDFSTMPIISSCICHLVSASSAPNGSSMRRIGGPVRQRAGDGHPLLHAAGKLARIGVLELGQLHELDEAIGVSLPLVSGNAVDPHPVLDILLHRHPIEGGIALEHHAAGLVRAMDLLAVEEHGAVRRDLRAPPPCAARSTCRSLRARAARRSLLPSRRTTHRARPRSSSCCRGRSACRRRAPTAWPISKSEVAGDGIAMVKSPSLSGPGP